MKYSNEFKRMQQLAGIQLNEIKINNPITSLIPPSPWKDETETYYDEDDEEYTTIKAWEAPGEGWDTEHPDLVVINKYPDNTYGLQVTLSFSEVEDYGTFSIYEEAYKKALSTMEEIMNEW